MTEQKKTCLLNFINRLNQDVKVIVSGYICSLMNNDTSSNTGFVFKHQNIKILYIYLIIVSYVYQDRINLVKRKALFPRKLHLNI